MGMLTSVVTCDGTASSESSQRQIFSSGRQVKCAIKAWLLLVRT